jgi:adenosine kinase
VVIPTFYSLGNTGIVHNVFIYHHMIHKKPSKQTILLSGSLSIDQIMTFDGAYKDLIQPNKLHVLSISTLLTSLRRTYGGVAGNIAYALSLLGEHPIVYGSLNASEKEYIDKLKALGADVSFVHYSKLPTAMFNVLTDKAGCQVGGFYVGAMGDAKTLTISRFKNSDVFVVISPHDPKQMVHQIEECLKYKKRLFFDVGQQILALSKEEIMKGLKAAELLIVNDYELGMIMKKCAITKKEILQKLKVCIITLGSQGADLYEEGKEVKHIAAVKVGTVLDPTGAGDAFRGGFLYGYMHGWANDISVELGCVVAAYAVETYGTQEYAFSRKQLGNRYRKTYNKILHTAI